jgi:hypothetical protein
MLAGRRNLNLFTPSPNKGLGGVQSLKSKWIWIADVVGEEWGEFVRGARLKRERAEVRA